MVGMFFAIRRRTSRSRTWRAPDPPGDVARNLCTRAYTLERPQPSVAATCFLSSDNRADQSRSGVHAMRFTLAGDRALDGAAGGEPASLTTAGERRPDVDGPERRRALHPRRLRRRPCLVGSSSNPTWDFSLFFHLCDDLHQHMSRISPRIPLQGNPNNG